MLARNLRDIPNVMMFGRRTVLARDASSKDRCSRQQIHNVARPIQNRWRPIARAVPSSYKAVQQLEAENVELRRRLAELALEIEALREG
jgi:hypothetical protein